MARHDSASVPPTVEERRLIRYLDNALVYTWKSSGDGRKLEFGTGSPLYEYFDLMMRMGDAGYELGAALFGRKVAERNLERAVRSHLLTTLARSLHDTYTPDRAEITETVVANFGRFVNVLIADFPEWHVEWAEDMDADDPTHDLRRQPVAVIRGVLLSPVLDQRRCVKFWDLAALSEEFPRRIFSDPCPPDDGAIFSSYHCKAFGVVFALVSDVALERFAMHMREHATRKCVRRWQDPPPDHGLQAGKWIIKVESATENERQSVFRGIAGGIASSDRRKKVSELFGLEC